jgi:DNA-binding transcriptional LysR family regulator
VIRDLCQDELLLTVSPSHPFASRASVSLADIAAEPFILPEPGSRTRLLVEQTFTEQGFKLRVTMQLAGTEAVKKAAEANLGVAMISRHAIHRELSLGVLKTVEVDNLTLYRPIHILYRKGKHFSPLARRFLTFATEYASQDPELSALTVAQTSG